ncbi:MAG: DHA2 family efflux MFS transporter permease subunit [Peptococcaceae bacterium]|nr:DHA2 family efflux MFS transporter permease subunit [Peptococcaceae bacterium]
MPQLKQSNYISKYTVPFIPILVMIAITNFSAQMNTTAISILLPVFMDEFQADIILVQWVVTAYILATCIIALVVGYISDRISVKKTFLIAASGFGLCTLFLGFASNIYSLIAMRIMQGIFGGMLMPLTQSMIYRYFPLEKQAKAISIWATTNLIAPTIAPSIAGAIEDTLSWRYIFFFVAPIIFIVIAIATKLLPARPPLEKTTQHKFDFSGLILSVIGSVSLLLAFSNITVWGMLSFPVLALIVIGLLTMGLFFFVESKKEFPLLHVKVFSYKGFLSSVIVLCVGSTLIHSSNNIIPVFLQDIRGFTTTKSALIFLPAPLTIMFIVPMLGKYYNRIGPQKMLYTILSCGIVACITLGMINLESSVFFIIIALILRDIGAGTLNMPATNMGMQSIPIEYITHAAAVTSWARQCVTSLSIGLAQTFQKSRTEYYMDEIHNVPNELLYKMSYCSAMSDLFHLIILCFFTGILAVYFSKQKI